MSGSAPTSPPSGKTKPAVTGGTITVFGLVLLNVTAVISLNNLPAEAEYGLSSIFYYLIAAVFFLIPVSLVAAELATGWPEKGGVFRWIGEAFRGRIGFMAMFLAWVEVCVFLPTSLTFGAVSLAYINPDEKEAATLSSNPVFVLVIVLAVFWLALFIALLGAKGFATMAKWGGIIGVFVPIAVLVVFGIAYAAGGNTPQMDVSWGKLIPDFSNFGTIVLAASIFLMYAGMEMNAVHVKEVKDATKNYPIAIFASAILTVVIFVLGTLAIAWIVPAKDINLTQAILVTYFDIFTWAGIPWAGSVLAIMLAIGVLVNITTWVAGPSTGLLAVAKAGYLPKIFQKTNKHGAAVTIMFTQAAIVTLVSVLFVLLPSVQSAYQILNQLANILYLTVYMLMFASIIRLRYSQKNQPRPFRLGKSNTLVWIIAGLGFVASLTAYVFSFIPPDQINVGSPIVYIVVLIVLAVVFYAIPNIIYQFRKPAWNSNDPTFAPFSWQAASSTTDAAAPAAATSSTRGKA
ncbi:MAG: putative glutamine/gamma-aminobutyrate antiporter GadC [Microbacterium sp.]